VTRAAVTLPKRTSQRKLLETQAGGNLPMPSRGSAGKVFLIHIEIELSTKFFYL